MLPQTSMTALTNMGTNIFRVHKFESLAVFLFKVPDSSAFTTCTKEINSALMGTFLHKNYPWKRPFTTPIRKPSRM